MPSAEQFFSFISQFASKIPFSKDLVALYFCMVDEEVPWWAKVAIGAAILYVITPLDVIPDFIPFAGWTDDAGVIASAIASIGGAMNDKHLQQADQFLNS